jgi:hypothetical protein
MYLFVFGFLTLRCWQLDGLIFGGGGVNLWGMGTLALSALQILGEQIGIMSGALVQTG